ncbi:uncharacterized protein NPIL_5381 [Nephila pilipes]|uniref:Uncharacterized protein n=1 Tax=Nephila pilipes TaxID=299642 RepID=A0A8X6PCF3_NEPPI|nr:uncharacterized protein NPIL_5381 [Nephila pilipes]
MDLPAPQSIDQASWILENSPEQTSPEDIWEIPVPRRRSLKWSIILSYIISIFRFSNEYQKGKFDLILGDNKDVEVMKNRTKIRRKPTWKKIREQVHSFNPFLNRQPLFLNKTMLHLVKLFGERLNTRGVQEMCDGDIFGNSRMLGTISKLLQCCIKVYQIDSKGERKITEYFFERQNSNTTIVLFQRVQNAHRSPGRVRFSFGMNLCYAYRFRRERLKVILKLAQFPSSIVLEIVNNLDYDENFLLALLKNSWREYIPQIYNSPYIPPRLLYAGFNTNPCLPVENGVSAFFHCTGLDSDRLFYILYDYVTNSFYESEYSLRCPSPEITLALQSVDSILRNDLSTCNNFSSLSCRQLSAVKTYDDVFKFNQFQRAVIHDIIYIKENYSRLQNFNLNKKIIVSVLKNYENIAFDGISFRKIFSYYIKYKECYENIDYFTCLLLFDNILHLNPTNNPILMPTIFKFFLTILSYKKFPKCDHGMFCNVCLPTPGLKGLQCIPFLYRQQLRIHCKELLMHLMNDPNEDKCDPDMTLKDIIIQLEHFPEIKDEFLFTRLITYLKTACDVSFQNDGRKGILAFERALQVLGETLVISEKNNIVGCLLNFNLPLGLGKVLLNLRNHCFSHYQASSSFGKCDLENDASRFESLHPLLRCILEIVQQVYVLQMFRVEIFLIEISNINYSFYTYRNIFNKILREAHRISEQQFEYFNLMKPKVKLCVENIIKGLKRSINEYENVIELKQEVLTLKVFVYFISRQSNKAHAIRLVKTVKVLSGFIKNNCDKRLNDLIKRKLTSDVMNFISRQSKNTEAFRLAIAVKVLSDFVINNCDKRLNDLIKGKLSSDVMNLCDIIKKVFSDIVSIDEDCSTFDYSKLTKFLDDLKSFKYFSMQEITTIKQKCLDRCKEVEESVVSLQNSLQNGSSLSLKEEEKLLNGIPMMGHKREILKKALLRDHKKASNMLNDLRKRTQSVKDIKDIETFITFVDKQENRNLLFSTEFPYHMNKKILHFLNRKVECLLHSMKQLKILLIEESEEIRSLYTSNSNNENARKHAVFLMRERYKRDPVVQLSLEMLLFDCQNILYRREDFKHLWEKLSGLFSGANLRDVLSHGNTVLQMAGQDLDINDLPANFIEKMLELVDDIEVLEALSFFWSKSKPMSLEEYENEIMQNTNMKSLIKKHPKWESYMQLLPLH